MGVQKCAEVARVDTHPLTQYLAYIHWLHGQTGGECPPFTYGDLQEECLTDSIQTDNPKKESFLCRLQKLGKKKKNEKT